METTNQFGELTNEEIILAGLDAARTFPGKGIIKGESGASLFRRQMLERIPQLPKEIQNALKDQKAQISDSPYYSTGEIKGTRAELIKLSVSETMGVTNIDNGKLNKDRYLVLSAFTLLYEPKDILGAFTTPYTVELLNGEWEFSINGRKVFEKMPVRKFHDGMYGYNITKPFGLYVLDNPKTIKPQTPIEFNVTLPLALTGFLKVFLNGTTIYDY